MLRNRMVLEQEGQLNAPDPRETNPPCYADAILMPRLQISLTSLKQRIASNESINSIRRATKRCRSEERLDIDVSNKNRRIILAARSRKNQMKKLMKNTVVDTAANSSIVNDNYAETSDTISHQTSFEIISQFETEDGHSPYSKRKPNIKFTPQIHSSSESSLNEPIYANECSVQTKSPSQCN